MGFGTGDDAGIYRISEDTALILTADFITPPIDDPYLFGQIAAANAISDIYAMGGRPVACLNLVAFPSGKLDAEVLHDIVAGGLSKITEAGAVLAGGHSIEDDEPKYGLSVTGVVHPDKFWTNTGARPGDVLILTKPLGSGVLFNANLKKWVSAAAMTACINAITTLNRAAAETMAGFDIHAATDVTGFAIAGHGFEMAKGSNVTLRMRIGDLPVMDEALEMYRRGITTGVNAHIVERVKNGVRFESMLPAWHRQIVYDPQTSGGLLAALPADQAPALLTALHTAGVADARIIGDALPLEGSTYLIFQ